MNTALAEPEQAEVLEVASSFRAMNTDIELLIYTDEVEKAVQSFRQVETIFAAAEDILSRFRPQSELCKLNRQGYLETASPLLYQSVQAAQQMAELTNGIFNPAILDALEAAGYDRSFEKIARPARPEPQLFNGSGTTVLFQNGWRKLELDPVQGSIRLPFGTHLDLGGIAKGATVDRATSYLKRLGFHNFMLSGGGDMWLAGNPPQDNRGWTVGIENPLVLPAQEVLSTLVVTNQAAATSSTMGRRWWINGQPRHHLIDPRTGAPVVNQMAAVTAIADTVQLADVMAKTALILGPEEAQQNLMAITGLTALFFVTLEGEIIKL